MILLLGALASSIGAGSRAGRCARCRSRWSLAAGVSALGAGFGAWALAAAACCSFVLIAGLRAGREPRDALATLALGALVC